MCFIFVQERLVGAEVRHPGRAAGKCSAQRRCGASEGSSCGALKQRSRQQARCPVSWPVSWTNYAVLFGSWVNGSLSAGMGETPARRIADLCNPVQLFNPLAGSVPLGPTGRTLASPWRSEGEARATPRGNATNRTARSYPRQVRRPNQRACGHRSNTRRCRGSLWRPFALRSIILAQRTALIAADHTARPLRPARDRGHRTSAGSARRCWAMTAAASSC